MRKRQDFFSKILIKLMIGYRRNQEGTRLERIAIVTDSNSGLSVEEAKQWNIKLLPMTFFVDGNEHKEGITLKEEKNYEN